MGVMQVGKEYMIAIMKEPNKKARAIKIPKRISNIRDIIGGEFEIIQYEKILIMYNKEQDNNSLKVNNVLKDLSFKGTVVLTGNIETVGDMRSLNKRELGFYMNRINIKEMVNEFE